MPNLLTIDTSSANCAVAVWVNGIFTSRTLANARHSAQSVLPLIAEILGEAKVGFTNIDAIAVMAGPGSFTGIRIGIGVAQGLSMANATPVLPISNLALKAYSVLQATGEKQVLVSDLARENEVYFACYRRSEALGVELVGAEQVAIPADIVLEPSVSDQSSSWLTAGNGWNEAEEIARSLQLQLRMPAVDPVFNLHDLCRLAELRYQQGLAVNAEQALPNYVKETMHYSR